MRSLLERLENYLDRKGLQLNTEKIKVVRFRKEGERLGKVEWMWKGKRREEVKEYKYLGYRKKWKTGRACKGECRKSSSSDGTSMGNRKEEIGKGLGEENMVI